MVRWQRNAVRDHLWVRGWQALAQLLGQILGDTDTAAAMSFRGEAIGDAPVIEIVAMLVKNQYKPCRPAGAAASLCAYGH